MGQLKKKRSQKRRHKRPLVRLESWKKVEQSLVLERRRLQLKTHTKKKKCRLLRQRLESNRLERDTIPRKQSVKIELNGKNHVKKWNWRKTPRSKRLDDAERVKQLRNSRQGRKAKLMFNCSSVTGSGLYSFDIPSCCSNC